MSIYDTPGIVREAWSDSFTVRNITAGFQRAEIFPFNRNVFTELHFATTSTADRPIFKTLMLSQRMETWMSLNIHSPVQLRSQSSRIMQQLTLPTFRSLRQAW
ncbi:hypothetical protein BaRGS_00039418 [Batillaria attramentaria]|uniref:Uncharacterized protein n=1 Tax=Batillaria attramentaria TaxID=370345 RepID=A0ABD0J383_9CAEN